MMRRILVIISPQAYQPRSDIRWEREIFYFIFAEDPMTNSRALILILRTKILTEEGQQWSRITETSSPELTGTQVANDHEHHCK